MRPLEIILALLLLIRILAPLFSRKQWIEWISIAALGVCTLHLIVEGYRWQMILLYGISLGLGIISIWRLSHPKSEAENHSKGRFALTLVGVLILGIALLPPILLPVPQTPEPTGPYEVGTITIMLVDDDREELYSEKPGEPRTIMVQIWYPANPEKGAKRAPWMENMDVMGPAIASRINLPTYILDHVKYSRTHAITNAPFSEAQTQFPLLLFSHGWGGFKTQNTYQVEELTSHGYVVVAPDHTYGATATVFPDGHVALNNPNALPVGMNLSEEEFLTAARLLGKQWAGDLSFILDTFENVVPDEPIGQLARRIDFARVGVLGHSTGGGAAIQFCATDLRCQAALGMDPYMDPVAEDVQDRGLDQPCLAMFSEAWASDEKSRNNTIFNYFSNNSTGDRFRYYIEKTAHYDFTDMPAFSPLAAYLGLKGPLDGDQVLKVINTYTLAYFDRYFREESAPILEQPSPDFPEMIYQ
jgi:predicted dienelactone hydrolase